MESSESVEHKPNPRPRRGLRRGLYVLPSAFTAGTLVCGYVAMLATLRSDFDYAAKAIGLAIVLDILDGRVARLTNSTSDFGREFDSLADVINFGVAPAFLAFAWGVRPIEDIAGTLKVEHLRQAGWVVTFAFVISGAARLARFNIQSVRPASDRRYFVGLPIPAAAAVVAAVVHWAKYPVNELSYGMLWLAIVGALSFLMISRMRYPSFKNIDFRRRRSHVFVIVIGIAAYAIFAYSEYALLVLSVTYALYGPLARIAWKIRRHPPATGVESSPGSEVHAT